jgi:hypothetical protein
MNTASPLPMINKTQKFILYTNGKCGGTVLKSWFLGTLELEKTFHNLVTAIDNYGLFFVLNWYTKFFGLHDSTIILNNEKHIRFFIDCYRRSTKKILHGLQKDPNYFKFAIVRDPYDRIVSAYVDKFCGDDLFKPWVQVVISIVNKGSDEKNDINFTQFVDYPISTNNDIVNPHWRRQSFIMLDVKIDKFINLNTVKKDLFEISELLKVKNNVKSGAPNQSQAYGVIDKPIESLFVGDRSNNELIKEKDKAGLFPAKEQFYNTELKEKVQEVYKEDFVRFSFEY